MSNISGQLIKDSYNYVLQSDLISGIVYRIGGSVAENPKFISGLTVNANFTYSDGSEFPGYVLTCDAAGNAVWGPVSGATSGVVVTGGTFNYSTGTLTLVLSNGVNVPISGLEDIYVTGGTVSGTSIVFSYNDTNTFQVTGITPYSLFSSYTASTQSTINNKLDTSGFTAYTASTQSTINNKLDTSGFTAYTATTQPLILNAITGGTYSNGVLNLINNSGTTIPISGFTTGGTSTTDSYVTGFTLDNNTILLSQNRIDQYSAFNISLSGYVTNNIFTSYTASTEQTISSKVDETTFDQFAQDTIIALNNRVEIPTFTAYTATTQPLILNSVTGGTYSGGTLYLINNSGTTIPITGFSASSSSTFTGGTVTGPTNFTNGLTANTISATTYLGNVITSVASVGSGASIYDSTSNTTANIRSITSDTTNKVAVLLNNQTINLGVNEQNLTLWNLVVQGNKLLNGSVSYVSGLTFSVSPLEYLINGQIYTISEETTVTLASGDSTFDRIDVIYADISGNTGVLQGVPSANPEKVLVDGDTEVEVTFVLVRANSTTADVSTLVIYNENSGPPSEWTFGSGGVQPTRIIGNFTGVTYSGGTSIRVSGVTGAYTTFFRLTGLTELNTNNYSTLQFAIRNLSANTTTSLIRFRFLTTGGTQNGSVVTMNGAGTANVVQYSPTNVSTWQLISIPLWRFYLTNTNVQVLEVSFSPQGTGAQSRYYFDLLEFVEGTSSAPPSNSWTTIQGDSVSTTITAPNPNATLILSGGTNISTTISGTSTVVFDLDNNIRLGGVSATTISATTYQNLPISGLTAGQNINISGTSGNLTISFTGTTGSNFTGGTVTGPTNFTNGLTANTISATTYQNLPVTADTFVTGFSLNSNVITLSQNRTDSYSSFTISLSAYTGSSVSGAYLPLSGGTLTGGLVANSGLTANTISQTSYIDFTTGSSNPSSVAGRVFFDTTQKALSYFDITNNQVPIAMGQQLYTRVWNATGTQIDKGKVIAITGTSNNLPSAILARNVHTAGSDRPIGLAAENIPNGSEGLVLNNGILSGITLNTFTNGDTLYLSDTVPGGYVSSTSSLAFTARTNEIGYVLQTGSTTGKIYVNINNEDSNLSLTDKERNILEGNVISSGVYEYTGMTQGTGQTINVAYARGWIVKNTYEFATLPDVTNVYYTGGTNIPLTFLNSADATFILINSASTLVQQTTYPTPQQRRENIFLGKVVHPNRTSITSINQTVDFDVSPMAAIRDLWTPLKLINQGILVSANGANLNINVSSGTLWGNGIGWTTNQQNPDSVVISGQSPTTFQYRTRLGPITGGAVPTGNTTTIYPGYYDNNGVVTAVGGGSNSSTNQRVFIFPTGLVRIQLGQVVYGTLAAAIAGSQTESFTEYSLNRENGILIGIISVNKNATNLSDTTQAVFDLVSKFGEIMGGTGGLSTTTLQQAYDNSSSPAEIVTNAALGALHIKNGTGNPDNVSTIFQTLNAAGDSTAFIRADGVFSGTSIYGTGLTALTISATTYLNLPSSTFTGGTVSGPTEFTDGLTANTIYATTISGDTLYGDGSNLINVPNIYNIDGSLTGDRQLSLGGNDLSIYDDTFKYRYLFANKFGFQVIDENTSTTVFSIDVANATIDVNGTFQTQSSVYLNNLPPDSATPYLLGLDGTNQVTTFDANYVYNSITGGTYSSGTLSLINNSGGTVSISGFSTGGSFTGGTVTGPTNFTSGLTANTISATTYLNLPSSTFTGGTVSGATNFTSGLTANTISATTYQNLPTDIRVTGATYERNSFTYTNNTGGTFSVLFNSVSGLTVQGSLNTITFTASSEFINYRNPGSQLSTLGIDAYSVLKIQGSYLYSLSKINGNFQITDVSNPNSPSLISTTSVAKGGQQPNDLDINGRYAYIVYNSTGTTIVDIENVKSPIVVYSADTQSSGNSFHIQGTYQYIVSSNSNRLFIYDISLATSPVLISSINTISIPYDVYIQGNYAYVVGGVPSGALQIIDISTPSSPSIIGSGTTSGSTPTKVYVQGRYAYVSNVRSSNFTVIDVSNPTSPSVVSQITIQNSSDFYIQGNNAYVASNLFPFGFSGINTTVSVVSISNPNSLSILSSFTVNGYPTSVIVQGKYLYVSDDGQGSQIFDLGSSYIQQLEAGGIETTTLTTLSNATVGNDLTVVGGMNVNQSLNVQGDISARSVRVLPVALTVISNTATTNASQSSLFTLTLTGNTTLATPINGFSGQRILYQLKQDGTGSKLLTLSSGFRSGPITVTLSTAANTTDYLGVIYNAIDDKWDVLALNKGYS